MWWCGAGDWCCCCCCRGQKPGFRCFTGCRWSWSLTTLCAFLDQGGSKTCVGEVFVYGSEDEKLRCVCFLMQDALLCLNHCRSAALIYLLSFTPGLLTPPPSPNFWCKNLELGLWPGLRLWALALASTLGCAYALLLPGPLHLLKLKLLAQAQGFGHHLPFLLSTKLLALASRWPLVLAPTSRRPIPTRQFASTSPQSSWTIFCMIVNSISLFVLDWSQHIVIL